MPSQIIVLGTLRSGTSLTAELVRLWGAYAGPTDDIWKSDFNDSHRYGYMEYIPLQELNDAILEGNDRVPLSNEILAEKASDPKYKAEALGLVQRMDDEATQQNAPAWVWKDARQALTLSFWANFLSDAIYIITIRHPAETILSAAKAAELDQEGLPYSAGFAYWQYCMLNILSYTHNSPRKIFIAYDQLTRNPLQECTRLCHFLDEHCGRPQDGSDQRIQAMHPQVSTNHRHYHYQRSLAEMEQTTQEQRALYNFLRVKTIYPDEAFNRDDFALYPGWREYLQTMDMLLSLSKTQET